MKSYLYKGNSEILANSSSGGAFKRLVSCIASDKETIVYGAISVSYTHLVLIRLNNSNLAPTKIIDFSLYLGVLSQSVKNP